MNDHDFNELAGRIEGLSRLVLNVTAMLEEAHIIDGPQLCDVLRSSSSTTLLDSVGPHVAATRRTLAQFAEQLDYARNSRQSRGDRGESQGR